MPDPMLPHPPAPAVPPLRHDDVGSTAGAVLPRVVDFLRARHPDLVVVEAARDGALADLLGFSELARAVGPARRPVLALPRRARDVPPIRGVLCGAGLSPTGSATLREAAALAAAFGAPLTVLHVMPPPAATLAVEPGWTMEGPWTDEHQLHLLQALVPEDVGGTCAVREAIDHGGVRERLLAWAEHADLVVVGAHRHASYGAWLSPVLRVMREAPCPVLAVPPRAEAGRES